MSWVEEIEHKVDVIFNQLQATRFLPPGLSREQIADIKEMTVRSLIQQPTDIMDLGKTAKNIQTLALIAKEDPQQLNVLKGMNQTNAMSMKDLQDVNTLMAKMPANEKDKLKAFFNPDGLTIAEERAQIDLVKNAFKELIKKMDKEQKLSPEQTDKLALEFAKKFKSPSPDMNMKELIKELDIAIKKETRQPQTQDKEVEKNLDSLFKILLVDSMTASEAGKYNGLIDVAIVNSRVTKPDPYNMSNAESVEDIAEALEQLGAVSSMSDSMLETAGVKRYYESLQPKPPGAP